MAEQQESRTRPDVVLLVAGALAVLLATSVVFGGTPGFWLEWSLAGVAVLAGLVLLVISMRRR